MTPQEILVADLFGSYRVGWKDGATFKAVRPEFEKHHRNDLKEAYHRGYRDGRDASNAALNAEGERLGYTPSILRAGG